MVDFFSLFNFFLYYHVAINMLLMYKLHLDSDVCVLIFLAQKVTWYNEHSINVCHCWEEKEQKILYVIPKCTYAKGFLLYIYLYIIYNFMFVYIYFFLLCLFSPSFCIAVIPSEKVKKRSPIVTKKLLRIIAKGTKQFTHKTFCFSWMIVTI